MYVNRHGDPADRITCPSCGSLIKPKGMGSHRTGRRCAVKSRARRLKARGFTITTQPYRYSAAGLEIIEAHTSRGVRGAHPPAPADRWVPTWAFLIMQAFVTRGITPMSKLEAAAITEVLKSANADPELRASFDAAFRLGGNEALRLMVLARMDMCSPDCECPRLET